MRPGAGRGHGCPFQQLHLRAASANCGISPFIFLGCSQVWRHQQRPLPHHSQWLETGGQKVPETYPRLWGSSGAQGRSPGSLSLHLASKASSDQLLYTPVTRSGSVLCKSPPCGIGGVSGPLEKVLRKAWEQAASKGRFSPLVRGLNTVNGSSSNMMK